MNSKDVIIIDQGIELAQDDVIKTFSDEKLLMPYIALIKKAVTVSPEEINVNTDKGRKDIASRSFRVSKIKTAMVKASKDSVAELKAKIQSVSSGTHFLINELDTLRDTTRAPLNAWEEAQKEAERLRVSVIREKIDGIIALGAPNAGDSIEDASAMIEALNNIDCSDGFDEFAAEALRAISSSKESVSKYIQHLIDEKNREALRLEREQLEKEREESKRAAELALQIDTRINTLKMTPINMIGQDADTIDIKIQSLQKYIVQENEFGDRYSEACNAREQVIQQLNSMKAQAALAEAQQNAQAEAQRIQQEERYNAELEAEQKAEIEQQKIRLEAQDEETNVASFPMPEVKAPSMTDEIVNVLCDRFKLKKVQAIKLTEAIVRGEVPYITINRNHAA